MLRVESEGREGEEGRLLGEVARMRGRMKEVADETKQKEGLYKHLVSHTAVTREQSVVGLSPT